MACAHNGRSAGPARSERLALAPAPWAVGEAGRAGARDGFSQAGSYHHQNADRVARVIPTLWQQLGSQAPILGAAERSVRRGVRVPNNRDRAAVYPEVVGMVE